MTTNKEVIDKLMDYFLKQDPKIIVRALANFLLDFNRIENWDAIPPDEYIRLVERISLNSKSLREFIEKKEHNGSLKLHFMEGEK
jgi:hypothetical protein